MSWKSSGVVKLGMHRKHSPENKILAFSVLAKNTFSVDNLIMFFRYFEFLAFIF